MGRRPGKGGSSKAGQRQGREQPRRPVQGSRRCHMLHHMLPCRRRLQCAQHSAAASTRPTARHGSRQDQQEDRRLTAPAPRPPTQMPTSKVSKLRRDLAEGAPSARAHRRRQPLPAKPYKPQRAAVGGPSPVRRKHPRPRVAPTARETCTGGLPSPATCPRRRASPPQRGQPPPRQLATRPVIMSPHRGHRSRRRLAHKAWPLRQQQRVDVWPSTSCPRGGRTRVEARQGSARTSRQFG